MDSCEAAFRICFGEIVTEAVKGAACNVEDTAGSNIKVSENIKHLNDCMQAPQ